MGEFTIQEWFQSGMKRTIPELLPSKGVQAELGPGYNKIPGCTYYLDKTFKGNCRDQFIKWDADEGPISLDNETVDTIHAHHIFEHVDDPTSLLKDCERILKPGGHINIVVPHWKCELAFEDIEHKHRFAEGTFQNIINNQGYDKGINWSMEIHTVFIIGIVERNMAIFAQLKKV